MGSPDIPPPLPPPAAKPTRQLDVEAEDITLGSDIDPSVTKKGKKALIRPKGNSNAIGGIGGASGVSVK